MQTSRSTSRETKTNDVGQLHRRNQIIIHNRLKFSGIHCFRQISIIEWSSTIDIQNKIGAARDRLDRFQPIERARPMEFLLTQRNLSDGRRRRRGPTAGHRRRGNRRRQFELLVRTVPPVNHRDGSNGERSFDVLREGFQFHLKLFGGDEDQIVAASLKIGG